MTHTVTVKVSIFNDRSRQQALVQKDFELPFAPYRDLTLMWGDSSMVHLDNDPGYNINSDTFLVPLIRETNSVESTVKHFLDMGFDLQKENENV